jgi:hypothetical protein
MTNRTKNAVVGLFGDLQQAQCAVDDLRLIGFTEDQIGFVTRNADDLFHSNWGVPTRERVVNPIGLITAGGTLRHAVSEVGGVFGGLVGALTNLGVPLWESEQYEAGFFAGMTLVVVDADKGRRDALKLLGRYKAVGAQPLQTGDAWN